MTTNNKRTAPSLVGVTHTVQIGNENNNKCQLISSDTVNTLSLARTHTHWRAKEIFADFEISKQQDTPPRSHDDLRFKIFDGI